MKLLFFPVQRRKNFWSAKTQIILGIRPLWSVFAVRMKKPWVLSYTLSSHRRLWSDCADAQADLSLRWPHTHFVGFVMSQLNCRPWRVFLCHVTSWVPDLTLPFHLLWLVWSMFRNGSRVCFSIVYFMVKILIVKYICLDSLNSRPKYNVLEVKN